LRYAEKADVVILDIVIDEMNGSDVARQVMLLQGKKVKLIYISSINACATETYELETAAFLLKPINKRKLKKICDILLYNEQL
jgi:two-component SAPR family response regulator